MSRAAHRAEIAALPDARPSNESRDTPHESDEAARPDDPWGRSDEERRADWDAMREAVAEDRAKNPRRLLASPSVAEHEPEAGPDESTWKPERRADHAESKTDERDARAHDQLDRLPVREPGDATRGLWTDRSGAEHELISGRDEYTPYVDEVAEAKRIGPTPHMLGVAKHVETKFAMQMREYGLKDEAIAVNNRPCPGELGCDETLPQFLPADSSLTVYAPEGFKKTYRSTETDQEGTRS